MLSDDFEQRKKAEIDALNTLKNSFFILGMIQFAFLIVNSLILISSLAPMLFDGMDIAVDDAFIWVVFFVVVELIYAMFMFVYVQNFNKGLELLSPITPVSKTPKYGALLYVVGELASLPGLSFSTMGDIEYSFVALITLLSAGVLAFVGLLLIAIGVWQLGKKYNNSTFKIGAFLMVIFGFIGTFIVWSGFDSAVKFAKKRIPPPPIPPWI